MRKLLPALLLSLTLMLCLPAGSSAVTVLQRENGFCYVVQPDDSCRIVSYDYEAFTATAAIVDAQRLNVLWNAYDIVLPEQLGGHTVTSAVVEPAHLASLYIPANVMEIIVSMPESMRELFEGTRWNSIYAYGWNSLTKWAVCRIDAAGQITSDDVTPIGLSVAPDHPVFTVEDGTLLYNRSGSRLVLYMQQLQKQTGIIRIPEGTAEIGENAMTMADGSQYFVIPDSVQQIDATAFSDRCTATRTRIDFVSIGMFCRVEADDSVTVVGWDDAQYRAALYRMLTANASKQIVLPVGYTYIPQQLEGHSVTGLYLDPDCFSTLVLPDTLTNITVAYANMDEEGSPAIANQSVSRNPEIGEWPLLGGLIQLSAEHPCFSLRQGMLYDKSGKKLILVPTRSGYYSVKDLYYGTENSMQISAHAPDACVVPEGTEEIGAYAFAACSELTDIYLPQSVTNIDSRAIPAEVTLHPASDYRETVPVSGEPLEVAGKISNPYYWLFHWQSTMGQVYHAGSTVGTSSSAAHIQSGNGRVLLVPPAITKTRMKQFTSGMKKANSSKVQALYSLLDAKRATEEQLVLYPDLANEPVYILKSGNKPQNLATVEQILSQAGYTMEDYQYDLSRINGTVVEEPYSLSCDVQYVLEGNTVTITITGMEAQGMSSLVAVMPGFLMELPVASGLQYMPQSLLPDATLHHADAAENRDYLYADYPAGTVPDGLQVFSQTDGEQIWICEIVHCDMGIRAEIPVDLTTLSVLNGAYAGIWLLPDADGRLSGSLTLRYSLYTVQK